MRARKKKNTLPRLEKCGEFITESVEIKKDRKNRLEIGCGKGKFIVGLAKLHPENEYFALERVPDVLVMAAEKCKDENLSNLHFLLCDAETLLDICPENSLDVIYLNFSDPWPKKRHTHRRLTFAKYLEIYRKLLSDDGEIIMKTDNEGLFEYSLSSFEENGYELLEVSRNLHAENILNEVMTEYETRFSEMGQPIFYINAKPKRSIK